MGEDKRWALTEDIFEGLAHGGVAEATDAFSIQRVDDGTVLEVDLGDPETVYIVTVTSYPRVPRVLAEIVGPSLRWATARITKTTRTSATDQTPHDSGEHEA